MKCENPKKITTRETARRWRLQGARSVVVVIAVSLGFVGCNYRKTTDIPPPVSIPSAYDVGGEYKSQANRLEATADEEVRSPNASGQRSPDSAVDRVPGAGTRAATPLPGSRLWSPQGDTRWWRDFDDPALDSLIQEALTRNQAFQAGLARVRQSRYVALQIRAARFPQISAAGDFNVGESLNPVLGDIRSTEVTGSAPVSYEVDTFARRAREYQAGRFDAEAVALDQDAMAISLSAEVAEAWFDAINARIEIAVFRSQLETDRKYLELVEARYREGLNSAVDVHQQRQRVAGSRASLALAEREIDLTDQRLSAVIGEPPGRAFPLVDATLPSIGPTPDVEVPATLLSTRPDIRAARRRVEAADRRVAAAIGERLPQITLTATPMYTRLNSRSSGGSFAPAEGDDASTPDETARGFTWSASANVTLPLFDGFLGRSKVEEQRAVVDELVESYAETILNALVEVESALVLERQERLRVEYLEDQVKLATVTLNATRDRYQSGLSDFLPVLTALTTRQAAQLELVSSRRLLVSYRVQLYRALGGSWPEEFRRVPE
ncbi:MAG: TolC family protein [Myxococcota bacterium]